MTRGTGRPRGLAVNRNPLVTATKCAEPHGGPTMLQTSVAAMTDKINSSWNLGRRESGPSANRVSSPRQVVCSPRRPRVHAHGHHSLALNVAMSRLFEFMINLGDASQDGFTRDRSQRLLLEHARPPYFYIATPAAWSGSESSLQRKVHCREQSSYPTNDSVDAAISAVRVRSSESGCYCKDRSVAVCGFWANGFLSIAPSYQA
jgi:hypothetical protein